MCKNHSAERLLDNDKDWLIHETSFKPWPSCRHTHAAIDAALSLRDSVGDAALSATRIEIASFNDALDICDTPEPKSRIEAKFSLQYAVSAALNHGPLRPEHFDSEALRDSKTLSLLGRCVLKQDNAINAAYPRRFGAQVALIWDDGRTEIRRYEDALGDPERPLDRVQLMSKITHLMNYGKVPAQQRDSIISAADNLEYWLETDRDAPVPDVWLSAFG